ncbi:membrane protein [Devosia sp. H5989]|uniref:PACE efflux transporter n=1 Tax=Paradevosia tibetensis TaxID=1447062 RepID=A0A5B9DQT8_9HYPH|nr:PACE efflux transporter [Youhaiella tibetensis]AKR56780.1 membrane protein [Devosia sp. H5989]QEE21810.1 PACE efflux transporter [Youhaiella tibetensis]
MRSFPDRVRHALMFEIVGLAIVIPAGSYLFGLPAAHMGVIGIVGATVATLWNFVFNLGFDHALLRLQGHTRKSVAVRVAHAVLFEIGLLAMLLPMIAWYLGVSLVQAFLMDMSMVVFYVVYAFVFNIAYDRVFPVRSNQPAFAG